MRALLDSNEQHSGRFPAELLAGQLLTPLTSYRLWAETYAIDNGAYTKFREKRFWSLLEREAETRSRCLFVAVPDVVGSARRTREIWQYRNSMVPAGWPLAYVVQDGSERISIPWDECAAIFIGGTTEWKMSRFAVEIIKAAKILKKHVHVGRVNTPRRWNHFDKLGADTCDGSGISRFDWMGAKIGNRNDAPLLEGLE